MCNVVLASLPLHGGRCAECSVVERSLMQRARTQGQSAYLKDLKENDEKQFRVMVKACARQKQRAFKEHSKLKFSLSEFREQYATVMGKRYQDICEMLWEGAYLKWCQSAEGGYLTEVEAREGWNALLSNPKVARDNKGPRGRQRLLVPLRTEVVSYTGVKKPKMIDRVAKLSKNMTDAQVHDKMAVLVPCATVLSTH